MSSLLYFVKINGLFINIKLEDNKVFCVHVCKLLYKWLKIYIPVWKLYAEEHLCSRRLLWIHMAMVQCKTGSVSTYISPYLSLHILFYGFSVGHTISLYGILLITKVSNLKNQCIYAKSIYIYMITCSQWWLQRRVFQKWSLVSALQ